MNDMGGKFDDLAARFTAFTGRILKTDGRYLLHGGFWSFIGQGSAIVSSLALAVVISRYVPKDVYGDYKYALAVIGILSIFTLNSLSSAVFQSIARGFDGALLDGFRINLRWSILAFVGALGIAAYYLFAHNFVLAFCILLGGCVMPFQNSANLFIAFLAGKKDFARRALYADMLGNIIPAILMIAVALWLPNLIALVVAYFIGNLAVDLYFFRRTMQLYKPDPEKKDPAMKTYGLHLSAIGILGGIAGNFDQILLFHFVSAADLAVYAFSIGILDQVKGPAKMLDTMMQAHFANRDSSDIKSGIGNKMLWMLGVAVLMIAVYYVCAPFIFKILFPAYLAAISYSRLYVFNLLSLAVVPISSYFTAHKKIKEQYISSIGGNAIIIIFMSVGTIFWGLWGLIAARVAASIASSLLSLILYWYATRIDMGVAG